jgi:hypothetical protein
MMVGMVGFILQWSVSLNKAHIIALDHIQNLFSLDGIHLTDNTPTFTWVAATGAPTQYVLQLSSVSNFDNVFYEAPSPRRRSHSRCPMPTRSTITRFIGGFLYGMPQAM